MKKRIGIDARLINQTGVGTYTRNLLNTLAFLPHDDIEFVVYVMKNDADLLDDSKFTVKITQTKWHSFGEQVFFLKELLTDKLDLMHFTYFSYPVLYNRPFIATIHDLTPLFFKTGRASTKNPLLYNIKYAGLKYTLSNQVANAISIITPSEFVKKQIIDHYGKKYQAKIEAIYEGVDEELISSEPNNNLKKQFGSDFFLYVGNFYPHKNVLNLVTAFAQTKTNKKLVLVGPRDYFASDVFRLISQLKQTSRILCYHNPTKSDFAYFYTHATALIHPSLSEGFGLPIAESVYFNLPIIASNIPVFKELLGSKYVSFAPTSIADIVLHIDGFVKNKPDYTEIKKKLSFKTMSEKTLQIYRKNVL